MNTILISPKECVFTFKANRVAAISFNELRKALSNNSFTPYHYERLSTVVKSLEQFVEQHFEEIPVEPTPVKEVVANNPITVDDFVKRMHELVTENEELKNKVAALETKLSEYETLKDMFLSI